MDSLVLDKTPNIMPASPCLQIGHHNLLLYSGISRFFQLATKSSFNKLLISRALNNPRGLQTTIWPSDRIQERSLAWISLLFLNIFREFIRLKVDWHYNNYLVSLYEQFQKSMINFSHASHQSNFHDIIYVLDPT